MKTRERCSQQRRFVVATNEKRLKCNNRIGINLKIEVINLNCITKISPPLWWVYFFKDFPSQSLYDTSNTMAMLQNRTKGKFHN